MRQQQEFIEAKKSMQETVEDLKIKKGNVMQELEQQKKKMQQNEITLREYIMENESMKKETQKNKVFNPFLSIFFEFFFLKKFFNF